MTIEVQELLEQKSLDIIYKGAATAPLGNMYLPSLLDRIAATYSGPGAIGLGGLRHQLRYYDQKILSL